MLEEQESVTALTSPESQTWRDMPFDVAVAEQRASGSMRLLTSLALEFRGELLRRDLHVGWLLMLSAIAVTAVVDHSDLILVVIIIAVTAKGISIPVDEIRISSNSTGRTGKAIIIKE